MFSSTLVWIIIATIVVTSLLSRLMILKRSKKTGVIMILTRAASMALVAWLLSLILTEKTIRKTPPPSDDSDTHEITVLYDKSDSMKYRDGHNENRAQLAEQFYNELVQAAESSETTTEVTRYFFAEKTVSEKKEKDIIGDFSKVNSAVYQSLQRWHSDALLVISDGAATDLRFPQDSLHKAVNQGSNIFTFCPAVKKKSQFDLRLSDLQCNKLNPRRISVRLNVAGKYTGAVGCKLFIDDKEVDHATVAYSQEQISFSPPKLEDGWHILKLELESPKGEVTKINNTLKGAFEIRRPDQNRLVFIYNRLRKENMPIIRYLKDRYPEMCEIHTPDSKELRLIRPENVRLLIIADITPDQLPRNLHKVIANEENCTLFLASKELQQWSNFEGLPLRAVKYIDQNATNLPPLMVIKGTDMLKPLVHSGLHNPTTQIYYQGAFRAGMKELLCLTDGKEDIPLLVCNDLQKPSLMFFLSDSSWKWHFNPKTATRAYFREILDLISERTMEADKKNDEDLILKANYNKLKHKIELTVSQSPDKPEQKLEKVMAKGTLVDSDFSKKFVNIKGRFVCKMKANRFSGVIWFQATANSPDGLLKSNRIPVVVDSTSAEQIHTLLDEKLLTGLKTEHGMFSYFPERKELISELLKTSELPVREEELTNRNHTLEHIIAFAIALLLLAECWLERKLTRGELT